MARQQQQRQRRRGGLLLAAAAVAAAAAMGGADAFVPPSAGARAGAIRARGAVAMQRQASAGWRRCVGVLLGLGIVDGWVDFGVGSIDARGGLELCGVTSHSSMHIPPPKKLKTIKSRRARRRCTTRAATSPF